MPNWCSNNVIFTHTDRTQLQRLIDAYNRGETAQEFLPCPCDLLGTRAGSFGQGTPAQAALEQKQADNLETYGAKDWFDWRVDHWGTKWDFGRAKYAEQHDNPEIKTKPDGTLYVELSFDTAWSPPLGLYTHLTLQGFGVKAYYFEGGMGFCGIWHDNVDDAFDIREFTQEWLADHVPANICEIFNLYEQAAQMEAAERTWSHNQPNNNA